MATASRPPFPVSRKTFLLLLQSGCSKLDIPRWRLAGRCGCSRYHGSLAELAASAGSTDRAVHSSLSSGYTEQP
ncbi:hypothetical protein AAFF_G00114200 [Aldrovandia affinis]|uniref:Uncharacterized protein n=1 Tax=Aldrovandia affinis TaxID=143900 RepID=A0AAD7WBD7_9TELE|nr:hypothetical protein AAFF_G00114200 [Aldrovandia affinis]